ncbi:MAG: hypothetical protein E6H02_08755 [Bacillati bacterium ANGP1]|uniref:Uncharacterized protein n=1 Tax=Candidatus Segetimicrobium genomatis TaxID=2569760 RepID=A0A537LP95_9BACT|nr:MAG: hypothetical protein E6H02_08755 [Terrabacteria group bacterium ANGP1]
MPKSRRPKLFAWRPVMIYIAAVLVAGAGLVLWDRAYEAGQRSSTSTQPEVIATNLVETIIGRGTVQSARLDRKTGTLRMVVKDIIADKGKTPAQKRDLLSREGQLAVEGTLGMVAFKQIVLQLVKDGKVLATVRGEPGKTPQTEFPPDLK